MTAQTTPNNNAPIPAIDNCRFIVSLLDAHCFKAFQRDRTVRWASIGNITGLEFGRPAWAEPKIKLSPDPPLYG